MQTLATTFLHRPYVFAFLAAFLIIGALNRGWGRTILFLSLGFAIAYVSEFSSIRNGFPYGMYHYVYENLEGELLAGGVPLWDSLSYSFLAYAAYEYGDFFLIPHPTLSPMTGERVAAGRVRGQTAIAAILMVLLDVVVDPLAVRGDRWFLGRIFYYPEETQYFGVPLTNFAGWLLVALAIFLSYALLEKIFFRKPPPRHAPVLGLLFYWGILVFNLSITFWIGEWRLGATGLGLHLILLFALSSLRRRRRAS